MKKMTTELLAVLILLCSAGLMLAHHALINFDTTRDPVAKGTIAEIHKINPHSFIFLDQTETDGQTQLVRIHRTLRMTPAMATEVTDRLWDVSDIIAILEAKERVHAASEVISGRRREAVTTR
jgi:hypothetical protein